jgi:hypothetical protein
LSDKTETEHVPAEFDLVLDVLQDLSLAGAQYNSVQDKWVLHVFWCENKPMPVELTDQQVPRREICNLAEIRLC